MKINTDDNISDSKLSMERGIVKLRLRYMLCRWHSAHAEQPATVRVYFRAGLPLQYPWVALEQAKIIRTRQCKTSQRRNMRRKTPCCSSE
eukprot:1754775-Amphidinium_carterae.1